jgi:uncharacterized protein YegL
MGSDEQKLIIEKIKKLQRQAKSEFGLGNVGASELFNDKAEQLMLKHNITEEQIDLSFESEVQAVIENVMGKTIIMNPYIRQNAKTNKRSLWSELLFKEVCNAYYCILHTNSQTGEFQVYGLDFDRETAIFMFQPIGDIALKLSKLRLDEMQKSVGMPSFRSKTKVLTEWPGDESFLFNYHKGFREAIKNHYKTQHLNQTSLDKINNTKQYFEKEYNEMSYSERYSYYKTNIDGIPYSFNTRDEYEGFKEYPLNDIVYKAGYDDGINTLLKSQKPNTSLQVRNPIYNSTDTVIELIDNSGSMGGYKIEQAKQGAKTFAQKASDKGYNIGLISFGSHSKMRFKPNKYSEKLDKEIDKMDGDEGSTNMSSAIRLAMAYFPSRRVKRTICIVTDGMPDSLHDTYQVADEAKKDGIEIMIIGTDDCSKEFIERMQSRAGLGVLTSGQRLMLTMGDMADNLGKSNGGTQINL